MNLFVQGFGVEVPDWLFVTVTPVPVGVKFTAPGPKVTFASAATGVFFVPSMTTLSSVTPVMCEASNPSIVTLATSDPPRSWKFWIVIPEYIGIMVPVAVVV